MAPTVFPTRPFPPSGDPLSIIGFGGIIVMNAEREQAARHVARAVELGVNYFDVAPGYGDAEEKLGPALEPYRGRVFLACKTARRDAEGARAELAESLRRLRTDYFDLYQLHALTDTEADVKAAFAKGGVMEAVDEARRDGRLRHVGFSAHSVDAALTAMDLYDFDSVLFPINHATFTRCNFGPQVLEEAGRKGMARLALKAMARGKWREGDPSRDAHPKLWYEPLADPRAQELSLRYTLSRPVTAALPPGEAGLFFRAVEIVSNNPNSLTLEEEAELAGLTADAVPIFDGPKAG